MLLALQVLFEWIMFLFFRKSQMIKTSPKIQERVTLVSIYEYEFIQLFPFTNDLKVDCNELRWSGSWYYSMTCGTGMSTMAVRKGELHAFFVKCTLRD